MRQYTCLFLPGSVVFVVAWVFQSWPALDCNTVTNCAVFQTDTEVRL